MKIRLSLSSIYARLFYTVPRLHCESCHYATSHNSIWPVPLFDFDIVAIFILSSSASLRLCHCNQADLLFDFDRFFSSERDESRRDMLS